MGKKSGFIENSKKGAKFFSATGKYCYVPPGHYYSPIVNTDEVKRREDKIWTGKKKFGGIDLNIESQKSLLKEFKKYYDEMPFETDKKQELRYYFENSYYTSARLKTQKRYSCQETPCCRRRLAIFKSLVIPCVR